MDRSSETFPLILDALHQALLDYMPPCPYRDFYLWSISDENLQRDSWLELIGVKTIGQFLLMLGRGLDDTTFTALCRASLPLSVYMIFEIAADNLAFGLNCTGPGAAPAAAQVELFGTFYQIMLTHLHHNITEPDEATESLRVLSANISLFEKSLVPDKLRSVAENYAGSHDVALADLEFAAWPVLVANINACVALARSAWRFETSGLITRGLRLRYRSEATLLTQDTKSTGELIDCTAYTSLVVPTLAYYVGIIARGIYPAGAINEAIENGSLPEALYRAAVMVRLLNDLGTGLLQQSTYDNGFVAELRDLYGGDRFASSLTITELIQDASIRFDALFTRLDKDASQGEFNLCLYNFPNTASADEVLDALCSRLSEFARIYQETREQLIDALGCIGSTLGGHTLTDLIWNFVLFHEKLYSHPYRSPEGEYAH